MVIQELDPKTLMVGDKLIITISKTWEKNKIIGYQVREILRVLKTKIVVENGTDSGKDILFNKFGDNIHLFNEENIKEINNEILKNLTHDYLELLRENVKNNEINLKALEIATKEYLTECRK